MDVRKLDDEAAAAPQISAEDIPELKALGYRLIVNNRPDGEAVDQPASEEIAAAAAAEGLAYAYIPVGRTPLTEAQLDELAEAMDAAGGPALLFCRSGTRSTTLWALAEARRGRDVGEIIARAGDAGYDLSSHEAALRQLSRS
jgi:uncharacterized protein (TIGR01244 family)